MRASRQTPLPADTKAPQVLTRSEIRTLSSLIAARRERNRRFANGAKLFCDPAWDILIDLLDAGMRGRSVSITGTCGASGVPLTTALRYIRLLEQEDLIEREADGEDGRRVFLSLTIRGWAEMRAYAAWLAEAEEKLGMDRPGRTGESAISDLPSVVGRRSI